MKLFRIILPVTKIDDTVDYYSSIFEMKGSRVSSGRHYFNLGETILALYDPIADGDAIETQWKHKIVVNRLK